MSMSDTTTVASPMTFRHGPAMPNRFMLAPLTNLQSHSDGRLSDEEYRWLTMRAQGGFGATMTCASHIQATGQGFPGQLGSWADFHIEGLARLASGIKAAGSVSLVQLQHAGLRSPKDLIGTDPVGPSADESTGAREMSVDEVEQLVSDFAAAAVRAEQAGFDGVELHGAHGYLLCAFLSAETNRREDRYGGSPHGRARLLWEIVAEVRNRCSEDFILGVRLSPERFGIDLDESIALAADLLVDQRIDFLDMSLWDCFKHPESEAHRDRLLIEHFTRLDRDGTRLGVAGKLYTPEAVARVMELGADFPLLGRAAILQHDFPRRMLADPGFTPVAPPVTRQHLRDEGLSDAFLGYMSGWHGFVTD